MFKNQKRQLKIWISSFRVQGTAQRPGKQALTVSGPHSREAALGQSLATTGQLCSVCNGAPRSTSRIYISYPAPGGTWVCFTAEGNRKPYLGYQLSHHPSSFLRTVREKSTRWQVFFPKLILKLPKGPKFNQSTSLILNNCSGLPLAIRNDLSNKIIKYSNKL